ncbi:MAG: hypothetical protein JWR02_665 [Mucilaginibacter sp.]|nr:hypothetical protein [Mucilaginibacter sp.]
MYKYFKSISVILFCIVTVLVALNIFTPLRLNTDAVRYLNIVEYLDGHFSRNSDAANDCLPHGYPYLLFLFEKSHMLNPVSITLINIVSILLSCVLLTKIVKVENKLLYFALAMLSFILTKQSTLSVSDPFFMLVFSTSIYLWTKFFYGQTYFIIPALLCSIVSVYVRTAGISLLPGIILYVLYLNKTNLLRSNIFKGILITLVISSVIVFIANLPFFEKKVDYVRQLNLETMISHPFSIVRRFIIHLKEIGEITLNIPYSKLSGILKVKTFDTAEYLLPITGAGSLFILYKITARLRLYNTFAFWVFLSYLLMIFVWPFYDTRFLMPVVPLFIYLFLSYLYPLLKANYIRCIPLATYILLGIISLLYSDAISLSKPFFLSHYGFDPGLTNTYRVHFRNNEPGAKTKPAYNINKDDIPYLLEKYDR